MKASALPALLLLLSPGFAIAQQSGLERVDSLIAAGQSRAAQSALEEWQRTHPLDARVDPAQRAHALYLTARLSEDGTEARDVYLNLVLSYPTSPEAPEALLRLGQAFVASGDSKRAIMYLQRLVTDYPRAPARAEGQTWLVRAQQMPSMQSALPEPAAVPPTTSAPRPAPRTADRPLERANTHARGKFALQAAAYRNSGSARALAARLRKAGFDARIVNLPGSTLEFVRVGHFETEAAANNQMKRMRAAGFKVIIVDDAMRERSR